MWAAGADGAGGGVLALAFLRSLRHRRRRRPLPAASAPLPVRTAIRGGRRRCIGGVVCLGGGGARRLRGWGAVALLVHGQVVLQFFGAARTRRHASLQRFGSSRAESAQTAPRPSASIVTFASTPRVRGEPCAGGQFPCLLRRVPPREPQADAGRRRGRSGHAPAGEVEARMVLRRGSGVVLRGSSMLASRLT